MKSTGNRGEIWKLEHRERELSGPQQWKFDRYKTHLHPKLYMFKRYNAANELVRTDYSFGGREFETLETVLAAAGIHSAQDNP